MASIRSKAGSARIRSRRFEMLETFHSKIAKDVWPEGAMLKCKRCEETKKISSAECGDYLENGWPEHHGETMIMVDGEEI